MQPQKIDKRWLIKARVVTGYVEDLFFLPGWGSLDIKHLGTASRQVGKQQMWCLTGWGMVVCQFGHSMKPIRDELAKETSWPTFPSTWLGSQ